MPHQTEGQIEKFSGIQLSEPGYLPFLWTINFAESSREYGG